MICGLDFGTSNSTIGIVRNNQAELIPLTSTSSEDRSVVFWHSGEDRFYVGTEALDFYIDGEEGRFFQSLKRYLSSENISTFISRKIYLTELIHLILKSLKQKAEKHCNEEVDSVVLGRPVHFHDEDGEKDQKAQKFLEEAAHMAGFKHVSFQFEPIAAALAYESQLEKDELVLVGDIGGGTSDFSIVQAGPSYKNRLDREKNILGNAGVYVGGNTFDMRVTFDKVTPFLGRGSYYRSDTQELELPVSLFSTVSQWHLVAFLKENRTMDFIRNLTKTSNEPEKILRLKEVIEDDLGYHLLQAVENVKINLSGNDQVEARLDFLSNPIDFTLKAEEFKYSIRKPLGQIHQALEEVLIQAGVDGKKIDSVFLTGGSTLIPSVRKLFEDYFRPEIIRKGNVFTSVGYGLALEAKARY